MDELVKVEAVSRRFPLDHSFVNALDNVDLRVIAGEFLAIAGPSGSGKSTLLNLIGCIDKPTSGRILVENVDTSSLKPAGVTALRREKIGFVFQTFNLIPVFTAADPHPAYSHSPANRPGRTARTIRAPPDTHLPASSCLVPRSFARHAATAAH